MKRLLISFILVLCTATSLSAETAYAIWCEGNHTLYFDYLNSRISIKPGSTYNGQSVTAVWSDNDVLGSPADGNYPAWSSEVSEKATNVVFMEPFKNTRPQSTAFWFAGFGNMTKITNLNYLNTSGVKNMTSMFFDCSNLTSLDLSNFVTSNVTNMKYMFAYCSGLTTLNLTGFNTSKVTDMKYMFIGCYYLQTILCNDTWSCDNGEQMFYGCSSLEGAVKFDKNKTDVSMANPETGYFTSTLLTAYAVWCESSKTLYFDYTSNRITPGQTYQSSPVTSVWKGNDVLSPPENGVPAWFYIRKSVEHVVFSNSFKDARPISTAGWFYEFSNLTDIGHLNYVNTSQVKSMYRMFFYCQKLTALDVTGFNTSGVTDMAEMFRRCESITMLNVTGFDTSKVTDMRFMFANCYGLKTIYCNDSWNCENGQNMFDLSSSLEGAVKFYSGNVDVSMANPITGYFTKDKFDLWLGGVQVSLVNMDNIPVSKGKASYDPSSKTLILNGVYLENGDNDYCIQSEINGLTIALEGVNTLKSSKTGIGLVNNITSEITKHHVTIKGPGQLAVEASEIGVAFAYCDLEVVDCEGLTITGSGVTGSMSLLFHAFNPDKVPDDDYETLSIRNSNVAVQGIIALTKLLLDENTVYMEEPAGGYFKFPTVVDAAGNTSEKTVIKIKKQVIQGDVNEDGHVDINDVVAIINVMAGNAKWPNANVNGDTTVDINDVVAVINIMARGGKE